MSHLLPPGATADDYYQAGLRALDSEGDRPQALTCFQSAVEHDPNHFEAWRELAEQQAEKRDYRKALVSCDRALELAPADARSWACRAGVLHNTQRFAEALESYDQAIALATDWREEDPPAVAGLWGNRGMVLEQLGRLEEAIASFDEAIIILEAEDDPIHDQLLGYYYGDKGNSLFHLGRYAEAIAAYNSSCFLEVPAQENRLKAYVALGREDELLDAYNRSLNRCSANETMPDLSGGLSGEEPDRVWCKKGDLLKHAGQYEEALAAYQKAFELNPEWHDWSIYQVLQLMQYSEEDILAHRLANYDRAIAADPHNHRLWFQRGGLCYQSTPEVALENYQRALELAPQEESYWKIQAELFTDLGRDADAIRSYEQALAINPESDSCWHNQALLLDKLGRYEEALHSFNQLLACQASMNPPRPPENWVLERKARLLSQLGQLDEAIAIYEEAIQSATLPEDLESLWHNRGITLHRLGRYEEAIASYDQAITILAEEQPQDMPSEENSSDIGKNVSASLGTLWYNRAVTLQQLDRFSEALASYEQSLTFEPNRFETQYWHCLMLMELGQNDVALTHLEQFIAIHPEFAEAKYYRAEILRNLERMEEAIATLQQLLAELAGNPPSDMDLWNDSCIFLGDLLGQLGRNEEAIAAYDQATQLDETAQQTRDEIWRRFHDQ